MIKQTIKIFLFYYNKKLSLKTLIHYLFEYINNL